MQAVKSAPHATCRMAFPCSFSTFFGCRYEAWSPCPSWPTILAPHWTFWREDWEKFLLVKHKTTGSCRSLPQWRIDTHSPGIQLLFHSHHCEVTLPCTHMLGTAASFKCVNFLGGELPSAPGVHLPWACGHHSNRGVSHCAQSMVQPRQQISYILQNITLGTIHRLLQWRIWDECQQLTLVFSLLNSAGQLVLQVP